MAGHRGSGCLATTPVKDMETSITIAAIGVLIAVGTFLWRVWLSVLSERRRRQKLVNAVYHHVDRAVTSLKEQEEKNETIRQNIKDDETYTPYVVHSSSDDLTYEQIIEVMEWLEEGEEREVVTYFYDQSSLHAIAESLGLEFVRRWPSDRKLRLWGMYEEYGRRTCKSAQKVKETLGHKLKRG